MRDRVLTPFLPVLCGVGSTDLGVESPGLPGRSLEGCIVENGRYLLRRKTGHTRTTLRFAAQDLVGGIEVDLHLHPDPEAREGYRLGRTAIGEARDLPDLCGPSFARATAGRPTAPAEAGGPLRRLWAAVSAFFRER